MAARDYFAGLIRALAEDDGEERERLVIRTRPGRDIHRETERMLAVAGIVVTDQGRARARATLQEAEVRMTPAAWARLDERFHRGDAPLCHIGIHTK